MNEVLAKQEVLPGATSPWGVVTDGDNNINVGVSRGKHSVNIILNGDDSTDMVERIVTSPSNKGNHTIEIVNKASHISVSNLGPKSIFVEAYA